MARRNSVRDIVQEASSALGLPGVRDEQAHAQMMTACATLAAAMVQAEAIDAQTQVLEQQVTALEQQEAALIRQSDALKFLAEVIDRQKFS